MQLYQAHNQWSQRPADERFWLPGEAAVACQAYRDASQSSTVDTADLRVAADRGELYLQGRYSTALLTHWAAGQLMQAARAPAEYIRRLPATLAAQNINHGLAQRDKGTQSKLLCHKRDDGALIARCMTGVRYSRIWNSDIMRAADRLCTEYGFRVPPARPAVQDSRARKATTEDVGWCGQGGLSVKEGDLIAPAGVYASDRDCFVFLVHPERVVHNPLDSNTPLMRGLIIGNSEVGDSSFWLLQFLLDAVCGNHIIWGAEQVTELRVRHVGTSANCRAFGGLQAVVRQLDDGKGLELMQARVLASQKFSFGSNKADVVKAVLSKMGKGVLSQSLLESAYDLAQETPRYGNPASPWGLSQALTQLSQARAHTDSRVAIDTAAGELLDVAF